MGQRSSIRWGEMTTFLAIALALGGCPKSEEGGKPAPSATVATPASSAPGEGGAPDAAKPSGGTPAGQASSFGGTYSLTPAQMYIPPAKDFSNVKQAKDDPTKHVGEGNLSLAVDAEGKVSGTIDSGPAAPAVIDGRLIDGEVRGNVRRKDPKDDGLTGTLVGKLAGDAVEGNLSLAEANAAIVREGKLSLKKK